MQDSEAGGDPKPRLYFNMGPGVIGKDEPQVTVAID